VTEASATAEPDTAKAAEAAEPAEAVTDVSAVTEASATAEPDTAVAAEAAEPAEAVTDASAVTEASAPPSRPRQQRSLKHPAQPSPPRTRTQPR